MKRINVSGTNNFETYAETSVEQFLQSNRIEYVLREHPAVFTCEDAEKYCIDVFGLACKNLFLRNEKNNRHFLVVLPAAKRADLKKVGEIVGERRLSFASPHALRDKLCLEPGSVSPFGLINDINKEVEVYIDKEVYDADVVNFHPNRNTASLELTRKMFHNYLKITGHIIHIVEL